MKRLHGHGYRLRKLYEVTNYHDLMIITAIYAIERLTLRVAYKMLQHPAVTAAHSAGIHIQ